MKLLVKILGILSFCLLSPCIEGQTVTKLPNLSANLLPKPTVGGFSSGGAMATNLHVIYSSIFSGVAGFSSTFYYCNSGPTSTARYSCSSNRTTVATSVSQASAYAQKGLIDPLSNLANSKAFFWSGTSDDVIPTAVSMKNVDFYKTYTSASNIRFTKQAAVHEFPTDDFGPVCPEPTTSFIGNCSFAGTYEMLAHLYGSSTIRKPTGSVTTRAVIYFDQKEFTTKEASSISLDTSGFYYRPTACTGTTKCRLHFFLHGCSLGNQQYIPVFMNRISLYKLAEVNNIIMVFPRAAANSTTNSQGCWDVFGYNKDEFANKNGAQVQFFRRILSRLYGQ